MKTFLLKSLIYLLAPMSLSAESFADYWYSGKAEVAVYDLKQSRYGKIREGSAVLIFVTEPFSKTKQVKLDNVDQAGSDKMTVMKLNRTKSFNTGIYPYSIMTSAFAEVATGKLIKASTSVQEWCGQTYTQVNNKGEKDYQYNGFSYFESEGNQTGTLKNTTLEEAVMLQLRLGKLKEGSITMTPSQEQSRLLHFPYKPTKAKITCSEEDGFKKVSISYNHPLKLNVEYHVAKTFPYQILQWSESFVHHGKTQTTVATLKSLQKLPYWQMNSPSFEAKRAEIGLD